ncbi:MAG: tRNA 5-methoxyuridine(34)/uridine 5-oxyacetic acid(34) synthase CmoB [Gammaproteobacteria bacterium]
MIDYEPLYRVLEARNAGRWAALLPDQLRGSFEHSGHGDLAGWLRIVESLPRPEPKTRNLTSGAVTIGSKHDIGENDRKRLKTGLLKLHPWRKGPYELFGIHIDSEWRSDWKWSRLEPHISPLKNRLVLDVGCGNGYYCWRMLGEGAEAIVGIDPTLLSVMQFHAVRRLYGEASVFVLPLGIEQVPPGLRAFDTVFSMGVLYHRRSPIDHLIELKDCLRPGGELVLETLVIPGKQGEILLPEGRYAKMRNVWFLPSCETLAGWMKRCGYRDIRLVDVTRTTTDEQRSTDWMWFHSLADFLDPEDSGLTVEGHPAPTRALFIATAA